MSEDMQAFSKGKMLSDRWRVIQHLGHGSFGAVYMVEDSWTNNIRAMKVERLDTKRPSLMVESRVLSRLQGTRHTLKFHGLYTFQAYRFVIMQLAGSNLTTLRHSTNGGKFSLSTTVRLVIQCVEAVRDIHNVGFLHRDIKPKNFAIGVGELDHRLLYLLDFGLARRYASSSGQMRPERTKCGFRGTVRYASPRVHEGKDYGRHDDLFSVLYLCVELHFGRLPWHALSDVDEVGKVKSSTAVRELLGDLPTEFYEWHDIVNKRGYLDKPNYEWFIDKMHQVMTSRGYTDDAPFDWEIDI